MELLQSDPRVAGVPLRSARLRRYLLGSPLPRLFEGVPRPERLRVLPAANAVDELPLPVSAPSLSTRKIPGLLGIRTTVYFACTA